MNDESILLSDRFAVAGGLRAVRGRTAGHQETGGQHGGQRRWPTAGSVHPTPRLSQLPSQTARHQQAH